MAEIKSEDTAYEIQKNPQYDPIIRKLKTSDPANAETIFNPLFDQVINNIHAVKLSDDRKETPTGAQEKANAVKTWAQGEFNLKAGKDLSNVTASIILNKVKTVDGNGSGLDADTVDGKHAADLQNYNNLTNRPTSLPANGGNANTVGGCYIIKSFSDIGITFTQNTTVVEIIGAMPDYSICVLGIAGVTNLANFPHASGVLHIMKCTTSRCKCFFYSSGTDKSINDTWEGKYYYVSGMANPTWTGWKRVVSLEDISKLNADTVDGKHAADLQNYNNLANKPTSLPANGGNADTVDGKHAADLQNYNNLANKPTSLPANGGNADTVDGKHAADFETPSGAQTKVNAVKNWVEKNYSNPNLLINGGFDVWQRGTYFNERGYTADRWNLCSSDVIITRGANTSVTLGKYSMTAVKETEGHLYIAQPLEEDEFLNGKTLTLSLYIKGVGNFLGSYAFAIGTTGGQYINLTNSWQKVILTGVYTKSTENDIRRKGVILYSTTVNTPKAGQGIAVANVKLELGEQATPFVPRPAGEELLLCQRYYQLHSSDVYQELDLCPNMRITPTLTKLNNIKWAYDAEIY